MAHQNLKLYGWCPPKEYQVHEVAQPALFKLFDRPQHRKGHVAFKTNNNEEPIIPEVKAVEASTPVAVAESEAATKLDRQRDHNACESVDQLADAFIKQEHRRIDLARLLSKKGA